MARTATWLGRERRCEIFPPSYNQPAPHSRPPPVAAQRILIDTACGGPGPVENYAIFIENLAAVLEKEGCTIERILLTHSHSDHFGGCVDIQERWGPGIPIAMMDHGFEQLQFGPSFLEQMKERGIDKILDAGAKTKRISFAPFDTQNDWFTKTGSGQK
jgi:glyoxylase-like metal-dependent hydrolase (beta-lactamase superfamily II)